ncbi:cobalamin biosynthesis protein CobG (plasmid) [Pseudorhodobacter turbinis]|uniref:Cobalamin biosynthesis protein CobG n=1 Tax=Pseudorhodobacter turbinis TaxID=2500533 RepID=A0A4P8ELM2_9RHOB|nr:cobalamin biosynthesis protein CobG [Pseudorhodobacter turbinis]QCO57873.1 cobalamin biosynthesis protein CobG [Pseudorhodobacter turbinis]
MVDPIIQGWCPGSYRPMMAGDGLVVRVRPPLSQVSPAQLAALADLAEDHGTGVIEATSRANLQIRGVAEARFATLLAALDGLGLIAASAELEARSNLILSPHREDSVAEDIAHTLPKTLMDLPPLPAKFGFVIDTGAMRHLATTSGDIRVEGTKDALIVRADGAAAGRRVTDANAAVQACVDLARWFQETGGVGPDGRGRMRRHLAAGAVLPPAWANIPPPPTAAQMQAGSGAVGAGFGLFPAAALRQIARATSHPIRVTPFRLLVLRKADLTGLTHPDLILSPGTGLAAIHGCTGAPACPQATVQTRTTARALAPLLPAGKTLHVSGCAKGCALQRPADFTLVGRDGRFDLIRDGTVGAPPSQYGLAPDQLPLIFGPQNAL